MTYLEFHDPHRQKHFDFFRRMDQPHFSLCANLDITVWLDWLKREQQPFTPWIVYWLARTANDIASFRQRIRGERAVEHAVVHPSFTVSTPLSEVFSFCTVPYQADPMDFVEAARTKMAQRQAEPSLDDEPGRDDYLFMSAIPWVSFTGLTHAMHHTPGDAVPRIAWGKYFTQQGRVLMPLSVQAHHALVDGRHMGEYYTRAQAHLDAAGSV